MTTFIHAQVHTVDINVNLVNTDKKDVYFKPNLAYLNKEEIEEGRNWDFETFKFLQFIVPTFGFIGSKSFTIMAKNSQGSEPQKSNLKQKPHRGAFFTILKK